jgi:hypothetical protein
MVRPGFTVAGITVTGTTVTGVAGKPASYGLFHSGERFPQQRLAKKRSSGLKDAVREDESVGGPAWT